MATIEFTNQKASQSLNGQAVIVTVADDEVDDMQTISEGMLASNGSSSKTGLVRRVDYYGKSFQVEPIQMDKNFESQGTYGYLAVNEAVIITL